MILQNEIMVSVGGGMSGRILLIDDDPDLGVMLRDYLRRYGFEVAVTTTGAAGLARLGRDGADLVILDVRLPDEDGFEVLKRLRAQSAVPVILLTGLDDRADRVVGLELGADDYLGKPFDPRELLARIRAVLRRCRRTVPPSHGREYRFAGCRLIPEIRELILADGDRRRLTRSELRLLLAFLEHPGRLLSRERLLECCHPHGDAVFDRAVDVQVLRLRRKLGEAGRLIVTERGAGYRLAAGVEVIDQCLPGASGTPRRSQ